MALDFCLNFVSPQYLENKWIGFYKKSLLVTHFGCRTLMMGDQRLDGSTRIGGIYCRRDLRVVGSISTWVIGFFFDASVGKWVILV